MIQQRKRGRKVKLSGKAYWRYIRFLFLFLFTFGLFETKQKVRTRSTEHRLLEPYTSASFRVECWEMGNSFGCSASGERLVSAARDGDLVEAQMLLNCNPCLAKYSTFGGLNSPLHFAAAKGHNEVPLFHFLYLIQYNLMQPFLLIHLFLLGFLLDCGIVAGEWSWCEFQKLLWPG